MSFFSGTSKIVNRTPIPSVVSKNDAVALLHDHEFFLLCDPHRSSHKTLPQPLEATTSVAAAQKHFALPPTLVPARTPGPVVKLYEVIDHVPNPVWSSKVVSREEFVDHDEGVWVRIRSPLGVVMDTLWSVRAGDDGRGLELVEDVVINCSRLVMGIVKGQVEGNWGAIHGKIIDKLVVDAGIKESTGSPVETAV
ncbi:hypothetical protein GGS21DRAFT_514185 [Xylaria nigripes]|nr:hypothetical protein GGS21DRAFT_514185 [Xylaria nigripes]